AEAQSAQREAIALLEGKPSSHDYGGRLKLYESNTPYRDVSTNGLAFDPLQLAACLSGVGAFRAQFCLWNEAASHFKRAITLDPGLAEAWHGLAVVLVQMGQVDAYRDQCRKFLARFRAT